MTQLSHIALAGCVLTLTVGMIGAAVVEWRYRKSQHNDAQRWPWIEIGFVMLLLLTAGVKHGKLYASTLPQKAPRSLVNYRGRGQLYEGELAMPSYYSLAIDSSGIGTRYGRRTQIGPTFKCTVGKTKGNYCVCQCDCGKAEVLEVRDLRRFDRHRSDGGSCRSCSKTKHGKSTARIYHIWCAMRTRCTNPNHEKWRFYGGRGIGVCDRWLTSFAAFLSDMGEPPTDSHSIDRLDSNGNYEPGNCCWSTQQEQANNRRHVLKLAYKGRIVTLSELSRLVGVPHKTLAVRLRRGMSVEEACNA